MGFVMSIIFWCLFVFVGGGMSSEGEKDDNKITSNFVYFMVVATILVIAFWIFYAKLKIEGKIQ